MSEKNIQKVKKNEGSIYQNCVFSDEYIQKIKDAMKSGEIEKVADLMNERNNIIGTFHPLYPLYKISTIQINGRTIPISEPISNEALIKYPQKIEGKFKVVGEENQNRNFIELLDHSYRTQTPIKINMVEMKKMLGDQEDPFQEDVKNLVSKEWILKPQEFPPAKPYKIITENSSDSLDYVLLRAYKIDDNNRYYLSNKEQEKCKYYVELVCDVSNSKLGIKIKIKQDEDKAIRLQYLKLIKEFLGKRINVISLEDGSSFVSGYTGVYNPNTLNALNSIISLLENILLIEEIFNIIINIPDKIYEGDIETIDYLITGIKQGKVVKEWQKFSFEITINNENINKIIDAKPAVIEFSGHSDIKLFDSTIHIPRITRKLISAKIDDYFEVKKKIDVLKVGDSLKLDIVPGNNSTFEDVFELNNIGSK